MAETKTPTRLPAKETNWLVPVAVVLGGAGIATGLYFYMKKPSGLDPGGKVRAHFTFDYLGAGGNYVLLVRFGWHRVIVGVDWFDPEEGMDRYTKAITLAGPDTYEFDVDCRIPDGAKASTYDAEGSVLTPDMEAGKDWIKRVFTDKAITVRKE